MTYNVSWGTRVMVALFPTEVFFFRFLRFRVFEFSFGRPIARLSHSFPSRHLSFAKASLARGRVADAKERWDNRKRSKKESLRQICLDEAPQTKFFTISSSNTVLNYFRYNLWRRFSACFPNRYEKLQQLEQQKFRDSSILRLNSF